MLQLQLHWLNTWLQWIWQRQLQDERGELLKFWDLVRIILEILRYVTSIPFVLLRLWPCLRDDACCPAKTPDGGCVVCDLVWHCCDLLARLTGKNTPGAQSLATTSQWRHNGRDCVSNHQPHNCLLNRLFRCRSKKTSKLRVTGRCEGNSPATGEFPAQRAVTWKVFPFNGDVIMSFSPWSTSIQWLPHGPSYQGTNKHSLVAACRSQGEVMASGCDWGLYHRRAMMSN